MKLFEEILRFKKKNNKTVYTFLILLLIFILLQISVIAYAHSGRTDSNGGHYDRSTGEYHYHHGYSAHQHPNGICPYDNDNNTTYSNSLPNNSNTVKNATSHYTTYKYRNSTKSSNKNEHIDTSNSNKKLSTDIIIVLGLFGLSIVGSLFTKCYNYIKNKKRQKIGKLPPASIIKSTTNIKTSPISSNNASITEISRKKQLLQLISISVLAVVEDWY